MNSKTLAIMGFITVALAPSLAFADDDLTSLSYISYLERYATVQPSQVNETVEAQVNMPILVGDRISSARGSRVEIQLADGSTLWLDELTTVDFDNLANSRDETSARTALNLVEGTMAVEIPAEATVGESLRLDSPAGSVFLSRAGLYRIDLRDDELQIEAHQGLAELPAGVGSTLLRAGQRATFERDEDEISRSSLEDFVDDFWSWVDSRRHPRSGRSAEHIDVRYSNRTAVLDAYGEWVFVDDFSSWMWRPRVALGWTPYSHGRWYWTPVGWNWVSYEPWGWYPSHYGSWYFDAGFGWVWGWDRVWGPAWVHWIWSDGYVGWCPRGYYDWWYYHNCHGCWNGHGHRPSRWNEVAFDFHGRVHLRDIDPRPWTFVPSDRFSNLHIDRVRLDSTRFVGQAGHDRDGFVRTGPLVTPVRLGTGDRGVSDALRPGVGRDVPDLGRLLKREDVGGGRVPTERISLQPTRTVDMQPSTRVVPGRDGGGRDVPRPGTGGTDTRGGAVTPPRGTTDTGRGDPRATWPDRPTGRGDTGNPDPVQTGRDRPVDRTTTPTTRSGGSGTPTRQPVTPPTRTEPGRQGVPSNPPTRTEPSRPPAPDTRPTRTEPSRPTTPERQPDRTEPARPPTRSEPADRPTTSRSRSDLVTERSRQWPSERTTPRVTGRSDAGRQVTRQVPTASRGTEPPVSRRLATQPQATRSTTASRPPVTRSGDSRAQSTSTPGRSWSSSSSSRSYTRPSAPTSTWSTRSSASGSPSRGSSPSGSSFRSTPSRSSGSSSRSVSSGSSSRSMSSGSSSRSVSSGSSHRSAPSASGSSRSSSSSGSSSRGSTSNRSR